MEIKEEIKKIEQEEGIQVIFLFESGSRAWGWESKDSDYDIRGVFIQDYTNFHIKDQINRVIGNLDIELWDFKKFLKLMLQSNPSVWEWLSSQIIYKENPVRSELKEIFIENFSPYSLKKHYASMARQNFEKYINNTGDTANLKKYIYVLRSIACINFIEETGLPPPKNYKDILDFLPKEIRRFFEKIIKDKLNSESLEGKRNKDVEAYVCSFWNKEFEKIDSKFDEKELEIIFKGVLKKNGI